MRRFRIGSAFGIPVQLDLTFLVVLPLFAAAIGYRIDETAGTFNDYFGAGLPVEALTGPVVPWLLGAIAALALFAGVLAHEFGHALVAMHYGYDIDSITLWIFGGLASLAELPENPREEFLIAVAGPVVSALLGIGCYGVFLIVPDFLPEAQFVLLYLGVLNVGLAVFNMLPAFPMDGGRVLRALLGRSRSFARATEIAAKVGQFLAVLMGLFGLFPPINVVLVGLAVFVYIAARSENRRVSMKAALDGVVVGDVMTPVSRLRVVSPDVSIEALLERMFRERHTGYPVVRNGDPIGMVTLDDAQGVAPVEREAYRVEDVMSTDLHTVRPETPAMEAISTLREEGIARLLVVDRTGAIAGIVSRTDLMTALDVIKSGGSVGDDPTVDPSGQY